MTINVWAFDAVTGAPVYSGEKLRQVFASLLGQAPAGRPLGANSGVRPGTPSTTVTVSGVTATIGPHAGIIDVETSASAGAYLYASDANVTKTVNAADATNPRIDLISVTVDDPAESDGSVPQVTFVYTPGSAVASPVPPATPAQNIALAQINVPASGGGASTVTWVAANWNAVPRHYLTNTSGQTIPNTTTTTVTGWATTEAVQVGTYSAGVRTILIERLYSIAARVCFPLVGSPTGKRQLNLIVNGVSVDVDVRDADAAHLTSCQVSAVVPLHIGDTVQLQVYQSQGSSQALTTGADENHWTITSLGPL